MIPTWRSRFFVFLALIFSGMTARAVQAATVGFSSTMDTLPIVRLSAPLKYPVLVHYEIHAPSPDNGMDEIIQRGTLALHAGTTERAFPLISATRPLVIRLVSASSAVLSQNSYCVVPLLMPTESVVVKTPKIPHDSARGRGEVSLNLLGGITTIMTDDSDVYFDPAVTDLKLAAGFGKLALEGVFPGGFGLRIQGGYEHNFYTSIGLARIKKSYGLVEGFLEYYFLDSVSRWDPYVYAGPSLIFSSTGYQLRLAGGVGVRYFFNDQWSMRLEPMVLTDFEGVQGAMQVGIGLSF